MLQQTLAQWRAQGPRADLWLFAYASLVWRPEFEVAESRPARVHGHHRALQMWSRINRGTEDCPGLVFALLPGGCCDGLVLRLPHDEVDIRPDSVGRGLPFQAHWLIDEHGQRLPDGGLGATGELVVSGPHVSPGYWNAPPGQTGRITPGPRPGEHTLRTGDVFRCDAHGWLYCVGRTDDMFKSRGEKVYPLEVEHAICELPGVLEAAVAPMPDERLGLAVKAHVRLQPGATLSEREVIRHCQARLESWMAPKAVAFVDQLPQTESGKLRRRDLALMGWRALWM